MYQIIFIVKALNESKESIEDAHLNWGKIFSFMASKYLNDTYGFKMAKWLVTLFSIETRRFIIIKFVIDYLET